MRQMRDSTGAVCNSVMGMFLGSVPASISDFVCVCACGCVNDNFLVKKNYHFHLVVQLEIQLLTCEDVMKGV